jgi:hypothetical protein
MGRCMQIQRRRLNRTSSRSTVVVGSRSQLGVTGVRGREGGLAEPSDAGRMERLLPIDQKGNTATVCVFTEPDPALRERFDGEAECTQEGHSLCGKTPDAETTQSFNRLRKEYRNGQMLFTSAIRLFLDDSMSIQSKHQNVKALRRLTSMHC